VEYPDTEEKEQLNAEKEEWKKKKQGPFSRRGEEREVRKYWGIPRRSLVGWGR